MRNNTQKRGGMTNTLTEKRASPNTQQTHNERSARAHTTKRHRGQPPIFAAQPLSTLPSPSAHLFFQMSRYCSHRPQYSSHRRPSSLIPAVSPCIQPIPEHQPPTAALTPSPFLFAHPSYRPPNVRLPRQIHCSSLQHRKETTHSDEENR